jgi:hypothetical protein
MLLHSNSSRVEVLPEPEELTLKPHSWSRVVFQNFFRNLQSQKALRLQSQGFGSSSAFSARDRSRFAMFARRFMLRTDIRGACLEVDAIAH